MPLFQQSSLTFDNAKSRVAEVASAASDTDNLTRAGYAVQAAMEHWNNKHHWSYLLTSSHVALIGPFTVATCTTILDSAVVTSPAGFATVLVGDVVSGAGIAAETTVLSVDSATQITLTRSATAPGTVTLTFARRDYALPSNFNSMYSVRLVQTNPRVLQYVDQRLRDRAEAIQTTTSTPEYYALFPRGVDGKIRFIATPNAANTALLKYFRRMTVPSGASEVLDIPQDYEFYLIGLAKALYLADKGGPEQEARRTFWWGYAVEGMNHAIADDQRQPDEDTGFLPGSTAPTLGWNMNNTTSYDLDY